MKFADNAKRKYCHKIFNNLMYNENASELVQYYLIGKIPFRLIRVHFSMHEPELWGKSCFVYLPKCFWAQTEIQPYHMYVVHENIFM